MDILFTQSWDIIQGKEEEYVQFITDIFIPEMSAAGLLPVGGYYVEVGFGPRIVAVNRAGGIDGLSRAMVDNKFKETGQAAQIPGLQLQGGPPRADGQGAP